MSELVKYCHFRLRGRREGGKEGKGEGKRREGKRREEKRREGREGNNNKRAWSFFQ